jgi:hypothetical protein
MEMLQTIGMTAWTTLRIIAANPFLLAFVAINAIGGITVWAIKRR